MAFAMGRCQRDILHGPQRRQAPLAGIRMAGAAVKGLRLTAVQAQRPRAGRYPPAARCLSGRRPARTARDIGQPIGRGVMYPALRYPFGPGEMGHR